MARKYVSPITAGLTPEGWQEKINLNNMTLDEMMDLWGDLKAMEAMGKRVGGYMKEACRVRLPDGETEFIGTTFQFTVTPGSREAELSKEKCLEEFGQDWIDDHLKARIKFDVFRLTRVVAE